MSDLISFASEARKASRKMAVIDKESKNNALLAISAALISNKEEIFRANAEDLRKAEKEKLEGPLLKRLRFDESKLKDVTDGILSLTKLEDPVGKVLLHTSLDEGLELYRVTCPIGVIGVIFESRPDALVQIASLCLKSGNAVFLKGGREAFNTNKVLSEIILKAGIDSGLPEGWLHLLATREDVTAMLSLDKYIDLIIPRGSNEFVKYIMNNTNIAVMGHADGVCHTYIDRDADIDMAVKVATDAKTQYVSVCNATETILIHRDILDKVKGPLYESLKAKGVTIYEEGDVSEWHHEYLDYKVSVKVVDSVNEAVDHINTYGSGHTDAIITDNDETARIFLDSVDSGSVLRNCSTRFADGFRYGFGAEVGISTSKLHARGPVGLEGLITYKYKLTGNGDIVGDYAEGRKTFKHIRHDV
ncbi:MAG: glutamate-5-semialdehyde dehydrogenase [Clostridiales bacterium]|nr:glutamate-5-semialdehyde dehydrogenase [Clostridiales bacterium]